MSRRRYRAVPGVLDLEERTIAACARVPRGWIREAVGVLEGLDEGAPFTASTLRAAGVSEPPHTAHWGGLLSHLRATGYIEAAGLRVERLPCGDSRPVRVWRRTRAEDATAA